MEVVFCDRKTLKSLNDDKYYMCLLTEEKKFLQKRYLTESDEFEKKNLKHEIHANRRFLDKKIKYMKREFKKEKPFKLQINDINDRSLV